MLPVLQLLALAVLAVAQLPEEGAECKFQQSLSDDGHQHPLTQQSLSAARIKAVLLVAVLALPAVQRNKCALLWNWGRLDHVMLACSGRHDAGLPWSHRVPRTQRQPVAVGLLQLGPQCVRLLRQARLRPADVLAVFVPGLSLQPWLAQLLMNAVLAVPEHNTPPAATAAVWAVAVAAMRAVAEVGAVAGVVVV